MNVKLPKRGWADGTHCIGDAIPDRCYVPIVPARYRNRTVYLRGKTHREVQVLGVTHLGYLVVMLSPPSAGMRGPLTYSTHSQLKVVQSVTLLEACQHMAAVAIRINDIGNGEPGWFVDDTTQRMIGDAIITAVEQQKDGGR